MSVNIFGKLCKYTILFLVLVELFSLLAYLTPPLNQVAFFIILLIALILSLIKLEYGFYLILAELFVGGHGYLFSLDINGTSISIRIGLFLIILAVWLAQKIKTVDFKLSASKKLITAYIILFIFVAIGIINGLVNNEFSNVFFDFNAWIYFGLIFVFLDVIKSSKILENILQIFVGATTYLALKTIGVLFLFSHNIAGIGGFFYKWIRDTGVGEITYIFGSLFRIFFQSQLYCLIGFFIILTILIASFKLKDWKKFIAPVIYLYLVSLAVLISQSRSFWVGAIIASISLIILAWFKFNFKFKKTIILLLILIVMMIGQTYSIQILITDFSKSGNLVSQRFKNLQTEAAGASRLNQLQPLTSNIFQQIILGYGFGKELTYQSNDPRILKTYPGGIYTTHTFEWGYLDIWLKLGALGLLAYLFLIYQITSLGLKNKKPIFIGLLVGLVALIITNIFSPYLNHPLGIGYIMLVSAIYNQKF